jgi:oligopeptidase A
MITQSDSISYEEILKLLQDLDEELGLFFTPLSHLNSVMNSPNTQKAYQESLPLLSKFSSEIAQNEALFKKIEKIKGSSDEAKRVVENEIRGFILAGVNLPQDKRKRVEETSLELSDLSNQFSQNLLDSTNEFELIIRDEKDVEGLPQSDIDSAKKEIDGEVVYRFTLQIPSYLAYMTYGESREYREVLYRAYSSRASNNEEVIEKILRLKDEKSKLLGFSNYAEYALESRDAPSQEAVLSFLEALSTKAYPKAKEELAQLEAFAKEIDGIESLESYDIGYYSEKFKKREFDFDDSITKPYFEQSRVLEGLLGIVSELFGVRFEPVDVKSWHSCVKVYDIYEDDALSGRIYFDLDAREEKRGGAWMNDWETHYIDSSANLHLPSAFIVCNFSPATDNNPSLLRHDDVVTLFHEMGHGIHHLFGKSKERSVSGINGVAWDVVEFPSQFLENFAYERAILRRFAFHYESGEAISDELLTKIKESKNFQASMGILRQVEFSLFDFILHQGIDDRAYRGEEIQRLLDSIRAKNSVVIPPSYNKFQHGFAHIFGGGYASGYYSYKWAEVMSADAFFECLDDETGLDKERARGYKEYILSNGGSKDMSELYREWLGREARVESLLKLYDIG